MKKELMKIIGALALCVSSAAFAEEMPSVKPNGCKGPVLCPSFPIYAKDRDCYNMYGGHIDIGFIWEQPWFQDMNSVIKSDGSPFGDQVLVEECFPYTFGVTASLGVRLDHDNWYVGAKFDWLSGSISNRELTQPQPGFMYMLPLYAYNNHLNEIKTNKATYKASIDMYFLDVLISRGSFHSRCFSYEPYAGVKAIWYNGSSNLYASETTYMNTQYNHSNTGLKFDAWGVGPMFGFNAEYYFTHTFSLFSDSDIGVLYGQMRNRLYQFSVKDDETEENKTVTTDSDQEYYLPVRTILGLKLGTHCLNDRHYVAVKIGYDARYIVAGAINRSAATNGLYVNFIWDF